MKTKQVRIISLLFGIMLMVFTAKAKLPELTAAPLELPQTFSYSGQSSGYIDLDVDNNADFCVYYSGSSSFYIDSYTSGSFRLIKNTENSMAELLETGVVIGSTTPTGTEWSNWSKIAHWGVTPPTATHADGTTQGYIGFQLESGNYGWINVSIDDVNQTVTLASSGYDPSGSSTTAGLGDPLGSTVPVPFIASALAFLALGVGIVSRRKRKK